MPTESIPRVTLIQCTDSKRTGTYPARVLYDESRYFKRMREWALARQQPWFILSGKHGLIAPDELISDYNERGLSEEQAVDISIELAKFGVEVVDITAGQDYTGPLVPELESRGIDVIEHFAGERIGTREKHLAEAAEKLRTGDC